MILNVLVHKQIENSEPNTFHFMCSLAMRQTFFFLLAMFNEKHPSHCTFILGINFSISNNQLLIISGKILKFFEMVAGI